MANGEKQPAEQGGRIVIRDTWRVLGTFIQRLRVIPKGRAESPSETAERIGALNLEDAVTVVGSMVRATCEGNYEEACGANNISRVMWLMSEIENFFVRSSEFSEEQKTRVFQKLAEALRFTPQVAACRMSYFASECYSASVKDLFDGVMKPESVKGEIEETEEKSDSGAGVVDKSKTKTEETPVATTT
ncbi:MAG: hypothetical protein COU07_01460 [Candidatus Harrisonbacteria bacterium CG10_big_fil_rev_8_21_14_0_10_40_38]|uniref:Uncharacterized protein n=1 Tax=Candidatus Harrisonbacteria bacterium CG10_big_fil_rev_8_21_14_0_10_40_38 TaxID=1974583 RepID=A0A2H0UT08_9BACT|nr:MAG: hypothetical protein COU07_01460 [Candidatus Harrisonbacteria bacterium CG10_big_fil_rev_8_21_14_0_10_40_38]